jgi:hypothetical protein
MKNNKPSKSFSFNIAKSEEAKNTPKKARDGVAAAGCSLVKMPWGGREPKMHNWFTGARDGGYFC